MKNWNKWLSNPVFYIGAGMLFMVPVIWISRTGAFYLCYFPVIIAAILFSGAIIPEKKVKLPSIVIRCFGFVSGMVISELIFNSILIAGNELSFQFKSTQSGWLILSIELVLGIAVFMLFFLISMAARFIYRKMHPQN